jgi:Spy/CpxP family protein refolding chaperone
MRTRIPVLTLFSAAVFASGLAVAQMPEVPPGKWWKRPQVARTLDLKVEQQEKLDQIFQKYRRDFVDLKADAEKKQFDVEELMTKKDSDAKKVSAAVDLLEQSRARLRKAVTLMVLEMRGILTEAQWKQVVEHRDLWRQEQRDQMRDSMRGRTGPRRPEAGRAPEPPEPPRPPAEPREPKEPKE